MSGNGNTTDNTTTASDKPEITLTEREKELFIIGMAYCNTAGPAKIDWAEFTKLGGFNTQKTAQNTWSKIKGKLPDVKAADDAKTPKKATPKKHVKKSEEEVAVESEAEETPAKKVRKTRTKKGKAKVEPPSEEEGDAEEE